MDPYAALRFREFNIFLLVRFAMVFAWSMQFIVIEWQGYSMTKDPLSLGIIGLMGSKASKGPTLVEIRGLSAQGHPPREISKIPA